MIVTTTTITVMIIIIIVVIVIDMYNTPNFNHHLKNISHKQLIFITCLMQSKILMINVYIVRIIEIMIMLMIIITKMIIMTTIKTMLDRAGVRYVPERRVKPLISAIKQTPLKLLE